MAGAIPWEIQLTLRDGTVYYFVHRELTSAEPHYFVVVNSRPLGDEILLLAVASSRVDSVRQRRRNLPAETLVEVDPSQYNKFRLVSIIDCNRVFRKSLAEFVEDWRRGVLTPKKDLPPDILRKLQAGVKLSPLVEEENKKLID